jgi:hypothetical protein
MRLKVALPILGATAACGAAVAVAAHPQVDPATVPTGFLTAHTTINNLPVASIERSLRSGKADLFIQHVRLDPNEATRFHSHPGPVFTAVQRGSVRREEAVRGTCVRKNYGQSLGFADRRGGVHRLVAGASGADLYEVHLAPRRTGPVETNAAAPAACGG